jgi:hypothetical protein
MNNKKNWFLQIITPPSPDEFDERFRAINSLAFRDALLAVVITIAFLIGVIQIPFVYAFRTWLFICSLPCAFVIGSVTYTVSRILRGGWNWSIARYTAMIALIMSPFYIALAIVPDLASGMELSPLLFVLSIIVLAIIPILIIVLSLRKDNTGASTDTPPSRSIRSLWQTFLVMLIMTICVTVPTLGYRFFGMTSPGAAVSLGFLVLSLLLLAVIVARMINLPLPRMLQNAPRLSREEKTTVNRRMLMASALLIVFSVIMLAGQLSH